MNSLEGECLCGSVRYEANADAPVAMHCYCRDCQRATGSAFATIVAVPRERFEVQGPVASYAKTGESGRRVTRSFCRDCGSQLFSEAETAPGVVFLKAGTLNDSAGLEPQLTIWTRSRAAWAELKAGTAEFEGNPETG
ncbi:MAG: GFA family protein [Candidatus Binatia bacterium]